MPLDIINPTAPEQDSRFSKLLAKYGTQPVPRYTSYPTAPHFKAAEDDRTVTNWLERLDPEKAVSLYLHIPFCKEICWYCGCNMKLATRDEPVARYAETLMKEIELVAERLPNRLKVEHIHFGGGSPSTLPAASLEKIMALLNEVFDIEAGAEIAAEVDPRTLRTDFIEAMQRWGFNRISLGIQEFDPAVQEQINRVQPVDLVKRVVDQVRGADIPGLNFDVLYGLPDQTVRGLSRTIDACMDMAPDRLALFGYAHVPWMAKRQRKIREDRLPGLVERAEQAITAGNQLAGEGYTRIGFDHFAKPEDSLSVAQSDGSMKRNFQGYTSDQANTLIGFGTTAIAETPYGYYQNQSEVTTWARLIDEGHLPTAKTCTITDADRLNRAIIEHLMCLRSVDVVQEALAHQQPSCGVLSSLRNLDDLERDGLVKRKGTLVEVTPMGRFFVRIVASRFDAYLGGARHSVAV